ncbi:Protein SRG1 [Glycine soja]|uniref:Protein SRG1 n=1 Tax=Glycine soja TaxID=3848 RepID=A0A445KNM4_GLYSO|nr:Protein SRG1 [Glycine soja]
MEEKKKFGQREGEAEGYGQLFVILEEQKLRVGRFVFHGHLFSNLPLPFRDSINKDELLSSLSPARVNPHSDGGGLAILLQANQVEGLQIKKDEQWIPVRPLPNAFIINFGDMIEITTNGIYRSIEHSNN